jgi:branched-chain amino acid transport system substrate-binding protein
VTDEFWTIAGESGEGTKMTFATDARNIPSARELVLDFETDGTDPIGFTLYTYAAVKIWADAANAAGSTNVDAVAKALRSRRFDTAVGPISFDEKGDINEPDFDWYEWSNGRYGPWAAPEPELPDEPESASTDGESQ